MIPRPRATSSLFALVLLALAPLGACQKPPPPPPAPTAPPAPKVAPPPAAPASVSGQTEPDCVGPFTETGPATVLKIGPHSYKEQGATLTVTDPDPDTKVVFGVIANLLEGTGENLFNLRRYLAFFAQAKAEAILVAGDTGETREDTMQTLEPLAKSGLPVFVIPGNREGRVTFRAALAAVSARYPNVVDMTRIRLVRFDDASIVSLPGYYDKRFIYQGAGGCQYFKQDVDALAPIVAAATQPVVLLSHAEPYGHGHEAIDAFEDGNAGDANLTAFLRTHAVPFGIGANIQEAGGRATDLDSNLIREDTLAPRLYLNPGLADSTPWRLNDGTWSNGMAATLTIDGQQASYHSFRLPKLTDAEEAEAKKLAPPPAAVPAMAPSPQAPPAKAHP